jgi:hypothetical protein
MLEEYRPSSGNWAKSDTSQAGCPGAWLGGLLSFATVTFDRQKAQGFDGVLQTILAQPFGRFLLTAAALGFVAILNRGDRSRS